jgi:glycosyltransferase involved in cell wall biosynthesis
MLEPIWARPATSAPEISVLMPVFNRQRLVVEAMRSVLAQTGCVVELLVSDDQSTDASLQTVLGIAKGYDGPHAVRIFRTRQRLEANHIAALVDAASCDFLAQAHDDDISMPYRMARLLALHRETGASLVTSAVFNLRGGEREPESFPGYDEPALIPFETMAVTNPGFLIGARYGFHRALYEAFPRLDKAYLPLGHDTLLQFRAYVFGGVLFTPERLLDYRWHDGRWSLWMRDWQSAETREFGQCLNRLNIIAVARRDLAHIASHPDAIPERLGQMTEIMDRTERQLLDRLVAARHQLRLNGYEPRWLTHDELRRANRSKDGPVAVLLVRLRKRLQRLILRRP